MALFTYKGVDYDTPAYPVQDNASATSLTPGSVPTGRTIDNVYSTKYMEKGVDYVTAGKKANTTLGTNATAEGSENTISGNHAHGEGYNNYAVGSYCHVEGSSNVVYSAYSHAENQGNTINTNSEYCHVEGYGNTATGNGCHVEGYDNTASRARCHVEGLGTLGSSVNQHVQGKYNVSDASDVYGFIMGNGTASDARSNAFGVTWNGDGIFSGHVCVGGNAANNSGARMVFNSTSNCIDFQFA